MCSASPAEESILCSGRLSDLNFPFFRVTWSTVLRCLGLRKALGHQGFHGPGADIGRPHPVGMVLEPAILAPEHRLAFAIALVDVLADGTGQTQGRR